MAAITVTATQGGSTANGMILRVRVVVGADTLAHIAAGTCKGTQSGGARHELTTLTTTRIGSVVWGVLENANAGANNPDAGNSSLDDVPDATNGQQYGTVFQTTPTVTPGAFTSGSADSFPGGYACLEILPLNSGGTITYDASGPALAQTFAATTITTASFTPPAGTLLMALVSSNAGAGIGTMTVSDSSGLTWTAVEQANATGEKYTGIWLATVPSTAGGVIYFPARPGRTWRRRFGHEYIQRQLEFGPATPITTVIGATASVTANAETSGAQTVVTVPGSTAQVNITAPAGTPVTTVIGATASVTVAAIAGTPVTTVVGTTAQETVAAPAGIPVVTVTGSTAQVTANAETGTVVAFAAPVPQPMALPGPAWRKHFRPHALQLPSTPPIPTNIVTGVTAQETVAAPAGAPVITVSGATAQVNVAAIAGTPTATVVGVAAQVNVAAIAGTPTVTVIGTTAQVTANAEAGSVVAFQPSPVITLPALPGPAWLRHFRRHQNLGLGPTVPPVRHPLALGGTEADENLYGGTVDFDLFDGTAVADRFDGLADFDFIDGTGVTTTTTIFAGTANDENTYGGVPDFDFLDGTQIGWTMQAQNITLGEFNDESIDVAITQNASAFNLTGFSLRAYFKVAAGDLDSAGTTLTLSSVGGSAPITITNTAGGLATIVIAKVNLQNANFTFWRVDVVNTGTSLQNTAIYGTVTTRLL